MLTTVDEQFQTYPLRSPAVCRFHSASTCSLLHSRESGGPD